MGQLYEAANIARSCASMSVLRGVSLALRPGRVHTMVGENGAGKSTLFKVLSGQVQPTAGQLSLDGAPVTLGNPQAVHGQGIYLVPQEPALILELSVAETMFVGRLPARGGLLRRIDWPANRQQARAALAALGLDIDVDQQARHLSIAQQQRVECAKALLRGLPGHPVR